MCKGADGECEGRQGTWDVVGQQAVSTQVFAPEQQGIRHVQWCCQGVHWHVAEGQSQEVRGQLGGTWLV